TLEEGKRAQKELQPGQRLVSQRGDLWRWDGYTASADAPAQSAIRLEQRNRLDALERELASVKSARTEAQTAFSAAHSAAGDANEAVRAAARDLREKEAELLAAQEDAAVGARVSAERAQRLASVEAQLKSLDQTRERAWLAAQAALKALQALPNADDLAAKLSDARNEAADARTNASEARAALETIRREVLTRSQRLTA